MKERDDETRGSEAAIAMRASDECTCPTSDEGLRLLTAFHRIGRATDREAVLAIVERLADRRDP